jgi:hypothetical protein
MLLSHPPTHSYTRTHTQGLDELVAQKTPAELTVMLQPWGYHFKRLLLDPSKTVRIKAAAVMAAVAAAVGKAVAPQLKSLLGPWYLASFDPYPDAAAAAKRSLAEVFPGRKQADALMLCRCVCHICVVASFGLIARSGTGQPVSWQCKRAMSPTLTAL